MRRGEERIFIGSMVKIFLVMMLMCSSWMKTEAATEEQSGKEAHTELREFSVVYNDRALNAMSASFGEVMKDLHALLTEAYNAKRAVVLPGSGTFAMEALARQVADKQDVRRLIHTYMHSTSHISCASCVSCVGNAR